jgi:hypothetical protein
MLLWLASGFMMAGIDLFSTGENVRLAKKS